MNRLIFTLENSLKDFEEKGNLDLALDYYNPNDYFEKVYFISYNAEDKDIAHDKEWLKVISPYYFSFLKKVKKIKLFFVLAMPIVFVLHIAYLFYLIRKEKISVSRTGHPYLMSIPLWLVSRIAGIPFISTLGGDNRLAQEKIGRYHIFNNKFLSFFVEEFLINKSDYVIVPNNYTADYGRKISQQNNFAIIPLPLRNDIFENLKIEPNMKHPRNFVFIGRFVGDKHPDFIVDLYIKYLKNNPESVLDLVMIGDGELKEKLTQTVKEAEVADRVKFVGFLNTKDIVKYLSKNPICLIPVSGFVIYEAAVFGNIIITSDIEWHSEFVENNINGWIGKYLDIEDWLNKLHDIENDFDAAKEKALKLRTKMQELSPDKIYRKQIYIYKKVLHEK